jgi:hypothetical protein
VNGYEHKGTGVVMKDGSEYVFDWWPTLTAGNPSSMKSSRNFDECDAPEPLEIG